MNRTRTAYSIARAGHTVVRGEHLIPANDERQSCTCLATGNYKDCDLHVQASRDAIYGLWETVVEAWPLYAVLGLWGVLGWIFA